MLEALNLIGEHVGDERARFDQDVVLRTAVIKWIETIGEAARGVTQEFREAHPAVPWKAIIGKRNRLTHGYFEIETDLVWMVVTRDLRELREQLIAIITASD